MRRLVGAFVLADLSGSKGAYKRPMLRARAEFDGDKSPRESGDKSPHSTGGAALATCLPMELLFFGAAGGHACARRAAIKYLAHE